MVGGHLKKERKQAQHSKIAEKETNNIEGIFFYIECKIINTFGFTPHIFSILSIQFCHCNINATTDNKEVSGFVPIKLYS